MKRKALLWIVVAVVLAAGVFYLRAGRSRAIVLTGIVTTDEVIVSPELQGRLQQLLVKEGDVVTNGQLLAVIQPQEWKADEAYYASGVGQSASQLAQAEADLKFQQAQTSNQIWQAQATLASTEAQMKQAQADLENARLTFDREKVLYGRAIDPKELYDQARTAHDSAKAHEESLAKQVQASRAAVGLAEANEQQVASRKAALTASRHQLEGANAQWRKAAVHLGYTEIHSPIAGIVDTRTALQGEVVNVGQAVVTLINQDNLWVRADVEETYIDQIRLGEKLKVRLPSGVEREGTVFYRGVDADYATQRDVSRSKRDIKTFEIRLRCDNRDRSLTVGMTAYVTLPLGKR
jgi:HlyD family secretion protein